MGIPAKYTKRFGLFGLLPFVIATAIAIPTLRTVDVDSELEAILPDDDPLLLASEEAASHMQAGDYVQILVGGEPLFSTRTLEVVADISADLSAAPTVALVVSATTVSDVSVEAGDLESRPLVDPDDPTSARQAIVSTPLFRSLLLTPGEASHVVYAFPTAEAEPTSFAADIRAVTKDYGRGVHAFGRPLNLDLIADTIVRDLRVLGTISLIAVFLVELALARNLVVAIALWMVSAASAVWTLAMYPVLSQELSVYNVMVPVTVLALATSYGIHILRYYATHPTLSLESALSGVSPIVLTAAATTIVGFSSLLVTPSIRLRSLGLLIGVGIVLALVASLFCLPAVFSRAVRSRTEPHPKHHQFLGAGVRRPRIAVAAYLAVIAIAVVGITRVEPHPTPADAFTSRSKPGKSFDVYHELTGANERLELYIDTGSEFGFIDMATYRGLVAVEEDLSARPHIKQTLAFPRLVEWMNGRLAGVNEPLPPENEMVLGETLEILFSQDTGLGIDALVDASYRRAKILLLFDGRWGPEERSDDRRRALFAAIEEILDEHLPGTEYVLSGPLALHHRSEVYMQRSQLLSAGVFFAFLVGLLLFVFRDLRWAGIAAIPTASGILFFYGLCGWTGMPISPLTVFFVAGLMGVSNDDVLYLTLSIRNAGARTEGAILETLARSGAAIVQTTIIIMIGAGTFAFSSYRLLGQGGLALLLSLAFCSLVTLYVVPALIRAVPPARTGSSGRSSGAPAEQAGATARRG